MAHTTKDREKFTAEQNLLPTLNKSHQIPANHNLYVLGDFNARLGQRTYLDESYGCDGHIGCYGKGKQNANGEAVLSFMSLNNLFVANTRFKHSVRHITTRIGYIKDYSASRSSNKQYYIILRSTMLYVAVI